MSFWGAIAPFLSIAGALTGGLGEGNRQHRQDNSFDYTVENTPSLLAAPGIREQIPLKMLARLKKERGHRKKIWEQYLSSLGLTPKGEKKSLLEQYKDLFNDPIVLGSVAPALFDVMKGLWDDRDRHPALAEIDRILEGRRSTLEKLSDLGARFSQAALTSRAQSAMLPQLYAQTQFNPLMQEGALRRGFTTQQLYGGGKTHQYGQGAASAMMPNQSVLSHVGQGLGSLGNFFANYDVNQELLKTLGG